MAIYLCELCGEHIDDDYDPGTEYGEGLICEYCVANCHADVEDELGSASYEQMSEEEVLTYHLRNM